MEGTTTEKTTAAEGWCGPALRGLGGRVSLVLAALALSALTTESAMSAGKPELAPTDSGNAVATACLQTGADASVPPMCTTLAAGAADYRRNGAATESPESGPAFACRPQGLVSAGESCRLHGTAVIFEVDSQRSRACLATDTRRVCGNVVVVHRGTLDSAAVAFEAHIEREGIWRLVVVEPSPAGRNRGPTVDTLARQGTLTLNIGDEPTETELLSIFEDPEREPMRYDVEASSDVVAISVIDGMLAIRAVRVGSTEVAVTATDSGGMAATWRFAVAVEPAVNIVGLPAWALAPIREAGRTSQKHSGSSHSATVSSNVDGGLRATISHTNVVRTLATTTRRHGGCMAELNVSLAETGLNCPGGWIAFSCDGTYAPPLRAATMFRDAQLAFGLGRSVSVSVTDGRKHNGHCVADRIDVIKR